MIFDYKHGKLSLNESVILAEGLSESNFTRISRDLDCSVIIENGSHRTYSLQGIETTEGKFNVLVYFFDSELKRLSLDLDSDMDRPFYQSDEAIKDLREICLKVFGSLRYEFEKGIVEFCFDAKNNHWGIEIGFH